MTRKNRSTGQWITALALLASLMGGVSPHAGRTVPSKGSSADRPGGAEEEDLTSTGRERPEIAIPASSILEGIHRSSVFGPLGVQAAGEGLSGLGDNGHIVDPLVIELKLSSPSESCGGALLLPGDVANLATYCGDLDGCGVRLVSLGSKRSQSPPVLMTTDSTGNVWTSSTTLDSAVAEGDITDGTTSVILRSVSSDGNQTCLLLDSHLETGYGIVNCFDDPLMADDSGNHTCTLMIQD